MPRPLLKLAAAAALLLSLAACLGSPNGMFRTLPPQTPAAGQSVYDLPPSRYFSDGRDAPGDLPGD